MKHSTNRKGPVIVLVAALILTACSSSPEDVDTIDISTPAKASKVACNKVADIAGDVDALNAEKAPGKRKELRKRFELDPNERDNIADVRNRLAERLTLCEEENDEVADAESSASATPTPSPTASATPSASPDPEGSDNEECVSTGGVRQWSELLDDEELKKSIKSNTDDLGFNWSDVRKWATDYEEDCVGARVALVFNRPGLSDDKAREHAGVNAEVPVVHVASCDEIDDGEGCTTDQAVRVILAPLVVDDDTVVGLRPGVGVSVDNGRSIIRYTAK